MDYREKGKQKNAQGKTFVMPLQAVNMSKMKRKGLSLKFKSLKMYARSIFAILLVNR